MRREIEVVDPLGNDPERRTQRIVVEVFDTGAGRLPVIVRWPLVELRFDSLDSLLRMFGAFGWWGGIRAEVRLTVCDLAREQGGRA